MLKLIGRSRMPESFGQISVMYSLTNEAFYNGIEDVDFRQV